MVGEGSSSSHPRGALLISNLPALQGLLKRDPRAYADEFAVQWQHYESQRRLIELGMAGKEAEERWRELVGFIAQVAPCYPEETKTFPGHLTALLLNSHASLSPDTRKVLVQSLVLLRNRGVVGGVDLLKVLFPLLSSTTSATMRTYLISTIQSDIRRANAKSKNHKLNRLVQGLLFDLVERSADAAASGTGLKGKKATTATTTGRSRDAMMAVNLASTLWRKQVWRDAKTVALVASACFHPDTKVQSAAIHFFLAPPGTEGTANGDSDEEGQEEAPDITRVQHAQKVAKKRRSGDKKLDAAKKKRKRVDAQAAEKAEAGSANFAALHLLHDPQGFVDRLYAQLAANDKAWTIEHRVLVMRLIARLAGLHRLDVSSFYGYVIKYLVPHQLHITAILLSVAEATHDLTPPDDDVLLPVVRKIAHEFVHPGVASEVVAAGINAITELCRRQPAVMEPDMLQDLTEYRKSKDKGVIAAARGLLALFRDVNPGLLKRRERGKTATIAGADRPVSTYGVDRQSTIGIDGIELLAEHLANKVVEEGATDEIDGWDAASDSDEGGDDSGDETGWINVESDDDASEIYISDSDDDEESKRRVKRARSEASAAPSEALSILSTASNLAAEQILTPADFAKLDELRAAAAEEAAKGGSSIARRKLAEIRAAVKARRSASTNPNEATFLTEAEIVGVKRHAKASYEERLAAIEKGREGREKYGSAKGKHREAMKSSTTNQEKAKKKNYVMIAHSSAVRSKKFASLTAKQRKLRKHVQKQKGQKKFG